MLLFQVTFELKQPWLLLPPLYYMKIQFFKIMFFISFVLTVQFTVFAVEKISFSFFFKNLSIYCLYTFALLEIHCL